MIENLIFSLNVEFVQTFGYLIMFIATFLESFPLFGLFVPGSFIIFIGGFLSKFTSMGIPLLSLWGVMIFAISGAILGDLAGYIFGRYFGKNFLNRYGKYFLIRKEYIERAGEIICNHSGKSLVIGRLNPLTRSAAPFIVGAHKVNFFKFMLYNIIGGIIWGFLFVSLGYFFGQSYRFAKNFEKTLLFTTILLIVGIYLYFFIREFIKKREVEKNFKEGKLGECITQWA